MKRHHGGQEEQSCWCSGFDLRVLFVLLRKCDRLLTPRTCQAAIAPTTMNAKAAKVAKLSTTCNRESRDQLSRYRGSLRDLSGLCVIRSVRGRVASQEDPFSCDGVSALPLITTPS